MVVEQNEPLAHAGGDLGKLVRPAAQLGEVRVDALPLVLQTAQQRRELRVGIVFERVLQVERVQRLRDPPAEPPGEQRGEHEREHQHEEQRLERSEGERRRRFAADGDAQHRAVRQAAGAVNGALEQRVGIADRLALAGGERLADLLAFGVVFQRLRVRDRVEEHRPVRADPCQAAAVGVDGAQIVRALALHARGGERELVAELLLLNAGEIVIKEGEQYHETRREHRRRDGEDRAENAPRHDCASSR